MKNRGTKIFVKEPNKQNARSQFCRSTVYSGFSVGVCLCLGHLKVLEIVQIAEFFIRRGEYYITESLLL